MGSVALVILFNHNYEANLERLDHIYKNRFEDVFYIMPFYQGDRKDVITVYENSYYFQGYLSRALHQIKNEKYDHYLVIGDDLLLNPAINGHNYKEYFKADNDTAFIPGSFLLNDVTETRPDRPMAPFWPWMLNALDFRVAQGGIEAAKFLPDYKTAVAKLASHGIAFTQEVPLKMFSFKNYFKLSTDPVRKRWKKTYLKFYRQLAKHIIRRSKINYPMVASYADCILVPHNHIDPFIKYCGIFAALHLFVEISLPTSVFLAAPKVVEEKDLDFKGETYWSASEVSSLEKKYGNNLDELSNNYPSGSLYIHPIKFSRWK